MLTRLLKLLQEGPDPAPPAPDQHIHRGLTLRLPEGAIVAEQDLCYLPPDGRGHRVQPLMDEAFVVVRVDPHTHWYATWRPYDRGWELLSLSDESPLEPPQASLEQARRAIL